MKNTRSFFIACLVILAGFIIYVIILPLKKNYDARHVNIHGIYLINPINIEDFELTDHHGNQFTKDNLKNHWSFLFFGFTHCEMVCPATLSM